MDTEKTDSLSGIKRGKKKDKNNRKSPEDSLSESVQVTAQQKEESFTRKTYTSDLV